MLVVTDDNGEVDSSSLMFGVIDTQSDPEVQNSSIVFLTGILASVFFILIAVYLMMIVVKSVFLMFDHGILNLIIIMRMKPHPQEHNRTRINMGTPDEVYIRRQSALMDSFDDRSIVIIPTNPNRTRSRDVHYPFRASSDMIYLTVAFRKNVPYTL